jgi:hypothetical protein
VASQRFGLDARRPGSRGLKMDVEARLDFPFSFQRGVDDDWALEPVLALLNFIFFFFFERSGCPALIYNKKMVAIVNTCTSCATSCSLSYRESKRKTKTLLHNNMLYNKKGL